MKKDIAVFILLICAAVGAGAQGFELSAGAGALLDYSARNGIEANILGYKVYEGFNNLSSGAYLFFDAEYVEADINFTFGRVVWGAESAGTEWSDNEQGRALQLGFSLLGKYPFELGKLTVFPLLGFDYNRVLSMINGGVEYTDAADFSQFGILAGGGIDYSLSGSLYLRGELLFHLRMANKRFKDIVDEGGTGGATMGKGARVKLGAGYRF